MNASEHSAPPPSLPPGLIIAATASGVGKTLVTLGITAALRRRGVRAGVLKTGPDYIDAAYHAAAAGRACHNLDTWAMRESTAGAVINAAESDADIVICEGVMGLFDGAPDGGGGAGAGAGGAGSAADIARRTGWPVLLVHHPAGQAASAGAVLKGFAETDARVRVVGALFNRVGSERHWRLIENACRALAPGVEFLAPLPADETLRAPSRHLGLVQAAEMEGLNAFTARAADWVENALDLDALTALARPRPDVQAGAHAAADSSAAPPGFVLGENPAGARPGARIAVARDAAFGFSYPHVLDAWRAAGAPGAPVEFFSPLADESPGADCEAVYLPGGYPELFAAQLAAAQNFLGGLRAAAARGAAVYGECGGYMVLGETITDGGGRAHTMAGLLPVKTSFAEGARKRSLGYRAMTLAADGALGMCGTAFRGHEFHYAQTLAEGGAGAAPLFEARDATGAALGSCGLQKGAVSGSFLHIIDRA
ncbi:MAG: cobyrinate a,c-diamide synthase [Rhodospirillales bacterium]